ncbi:MAG: sarcosine oxidase subunit gamma [Paracoccaceae bacterium]
MADFVLKAQPALGGYSEDFEGTRLEEVADLAIVSLATPLGGEAAVAEALTAAYGCEVPPVGRSALSADGATRLLAMARDQLFVVFPHAPPDALSVVAEKTGGAGYLTDQSDTWFALRLSGPGALGALERICLLDLHESAFPPGSAARTVMEHMGCIVLREMEDTFLLLSARSSARSFLHAVETSLRYTT